jgi:hypothetical protein
MASWNKVLAVAAALTLMVAANGEVFFEENFDGVLWKSRCALCGDP